MADRKRCCCNCERNIRHEVEPHGIECYCEIDGHRIGYIECFEGWCRRWKKDHTFDGMEEPKEQKVIKNYKKLLTNKQGCGKIYSQGDNTLY